MTDLAQDTSVSTPKTRLWQDAFRLLWNARAQWGVSFGVLALIDVVFRLVCHPFVAPIVAGVRLWINTPREERQGALLQSLAGQQIVAYVSYEFILVIFWLFAFYFMTSRLIKADGYFDVSPKPWTSFPRYLGKLSLFGIFVTIALVISQIAFLLPLGFAFAETLKNPSALTVVIVNGFDVLITGGIILFMFVRYTFLAPLSLVRAPEVMHASWALSRDSFFALFGNLLFVELVAFVLAFLVAFFFLSLGKLGIEGVVPESISSALSSLLFALPYAGLLATGLHRMYAEKRKRYPGLVLPLV